MKQQTKVASSTIKWSTTRETACFLKELAGNNGSSVKSLGTCESIARALTEQRARPVEEFMSGETVIDGQPTKPLAEVVIMAHAHCRTIRKKIMAKFATTIKIEEVA